uniref:Cms1 ribosomal small subunit homolog n=1 Tax=Astatotilapia calliptera TaxID=8154 RepID=A0AAX7VL43_ASTCA
MGDDLGDEWWQHEYKSDASEVEEEETEQKKKPAEKTKTKPEKRKIVTEKPAKAKKKKNNEQNEQMIPPRKETQDEKSAKPPKKRKKKKTITDVLATSEPKPGCPADLQDLVTQYFKDKRSVIEQEELKVQGESRQITLSLHIQSISAEMLTHRDQRVLSHPPDSFFLSSNDLTHTLSSYLKQIAPKWAKIQKQHTEKSSVVLLVVCSSALRTIELIKQLTSFKGEAKAVKLFAKHIKIEEQVKLLQKGIYHIGVGTPGRISALVEREGLSLQALRYLVLDWNWRDQKLRRMVDIPEIKQDLMKLLESGVLARCKEDKVKIGLF